MRLLILAGLSALAAASGAAAQPQSSTDPCFLSRYVRGHTTDGKDSVYLNVDGTAVFRVSTDATCLSHATASDPILIADRGSGKVCTRQDIELQVRGLRCIVKSVTKLTPAEVSALPKALQP